MKASGHRLILYLMIASLLFISSCNKDALDSGGQTQTGLDYIFQDKTEIETVYCYRINPWSAQGEIHSGLDIAPKFSSLLGTQTIKPVAVIAPAGGEIELLLEHESGAGAKMFSVVIKMNTYWRLIMSFEPQSADAEVVDLQRNAFLVAQGDTVQRGQKIADLIVGRILEDRYPHIHFSILYLNPPDTLETIAQTIDTLTRNNGVPAPPARVGVGSPFNPVNLGVETQFFCPYLYFSNEAQAILNSVPARSTTGECSCLCAYNSENGDCGVCAP